MSGHSHWSTIKHKKGAADARKSAVFSKLAREITIAAKEGGSDQSFNPKLRMAVEKARSLNMPTENIERSVKRGTGELEGQILEKITIEAFGPGNAAIIIEGITDNKNRSLGEIKQILSQNNGKLAGEGSVRWLFERKGCITINSSSQLPSAKNKEEIEVAAIEAGAEDLAWQDDILDVYVKPEELEKTRKGLEEKLVKIENISLDWVAKEKIFLAENEKNLCRKLFEALDENDSVQEIYFNADL